MVAQQPRTDTNARVSTRSHGHGPRCHTPAARWSRVATPRFRVARHGTSTRNRHARHPHSCPHATRRPRARRTARRDPAVGRRRPGGGRGGLAGPGRARRRTRRCRRRRPRRGHQQRGGGPLRARPRARGPRRRVGPPGRPAPGLRRPARVVGHRRHRVGPGARRAARPRRSRGGRARRRHGPCGRAGSGAPRPPREPQRAQRPRPQVPPHGRGHGPPEHPSGARRPRRRVPPHPRPGHRSRRAPRGPLLGRLVARVADAGGHVEPAGPHLDARRGAPPARRRAARRGRATPHPPAGRAPGGTRLGGVAHHRGRGQRNGAGRRLLLLSRSRLLVRRGLLQPCGARGPAPSGLGRRHPGRAGVAPVLAAVRDALSDAST